MWIARASTWGAGERRLGDGSGRLGRGGAAWTNFVDQGDFTKTLPANDHGWAGTKNPRPNEVEWLPPW